MSESRRELTEREREGPRCGARLPKRVLSPGCSLASGHAGEHLNTATGIQWGDEVYAPAPIEIARCPQHGLHGARETCFECGGPVEQIRVVPVSSEATFELPADLKAVLSDPSIIISQDQHVFELIARWQKAECPTLSAPARPVVEASGEREDQSNQRSGDASDASGAVPSTGVGPNRPDSDSGALGTDEQRGPSGGQGISGRLDTRVPDEAGQADASDRMYSAVEVEAIIEAAHGHGEKAGADRAEGALDENEVDAFPLTIQAAVREAEELLMRPIGAASRVPSAPGELVSVLVRDLRAGDEVLLRVDQVLAAAGGRVALVGVETGPFFGEQQILRARHPDGS